MKARGNCPDQAGTRRGGGEREEEGEGEERGARAEHEDPYRNSIKKKFEI